MAFEELLTMDLPTGEQIAYRKREGGTIPVVLLHGNLSSSVVWDVAFEGMDDRFSLYAMDIRGFGDSTLETPIDCIADLATDVKQFVDGLGLETFSLWGWSTGGGAAMQVAADWPDRVERLVLMAPPSTQGLPFYERDEDGQPTGKVLTTYEELAARDGVQPIRDALEDHDAQTMRGVWDQAIYHTDNPERERLERYIEGALKTRHYLDVLYALTHFNISPDNNGIEPGTGEVERITAPTLIVRGEYDSVIDRDLVLKAHEDIADSRFVEFNDCGHGPTVDAPDRVLAEVVPFLAGE